MKAYLIRRLLLIIPTFVGISLLTFFIIQLAPGSPVMSRLQGVEGAMSSDAASQEIVAQLKERYGLDEPMWKQYANWLGSMLTLDFGDSFEDQQPVMRKIGDALPITLQINLLSLFFIYLLSIPIGVYSANNAGKIGERGMTVFLFLLFSVPSFWMAMLAILFLGGGEYYDVFPVYGISSTGAEDWGFWRWLGDRLLHLILPTFCLSYAGLAVVSRYMRTGMLDVLRQDYIRTARAYGFGERRVVWVYAMRNSLIPIVTLLGGILPTLIGGSVIIETIFSIPGMGRLAFEAVLFRDYPVIMGTVTMSALLTLGGLILSDILYVLVDPRIQLK